jgi:hypothetical protein
MLETHPLAYAPHTQQCKALSDRKTYRCQKRARILGGASPHPPPPPLTHTLAHTGTSTHLRQQLELILLVATHARASHVRLPSASPLRLRGLLQGCVTQTSNKRGATGLVLGNACTTRLHKTLTISVAVEIATDHQTHYSNAAHQKMNNATHRRRTHPVATTPTTAAAAAWTTTHAPANVASTGAASTPTGVGPTHQLELDQGGGPRLAVHRVPDRPQLRHGVRRAAALTVPAVPYRDGQRENMGREIGGVRS